jgi:hypothetical protein
VNARLIRPRRARIASRRTTPAPVLATLPFVSFPVELKKQLGNRETILPLARKKAEALEL